MTAPALPVPATVYMDRFANARSVPRFAQLTQQLDGTHPYVRIVTLDVSCAPAALLPEAAKVERCVTTDDSVTVLARLDDAVIQIGANSGTTSIEVSAACPRRADEIAARMRGTVPALPDGAVSVRIWHHTGDRNAVATNRMLEAPRWGSIATNYPGRTRSALEALTALESPTATGKLILWHGPPGTGETTALRSLMRSWSGWCQPQYISDPEKFFGLPSYMSQVLTAPATAGTAPTIDRPGRSDALWRLVIAEDADEYLRASARRDAGAALGRLLNLADGILGQGMNVLVLLTTNEETSRLHPALVRPGRCLAAVEFPPFEPAQAATWLGKPVDRSMTLAELLERRGDIVRVGGPEQAPTSVGHYL